MGPIYNYTVELHCEEEGALIRGEQSCRRPWKGMEGRGRAWKDVEGRGRAWKGVEGRGKRGRALKGVEGRGRAWKDVEGRGRAWSVPGRRLKARTEFLSSLSTRNKCTSGLGKTPLN